VVQPPQPVNNVMSIGDYIWFIFNGFYAQSFIQ
jgi:hypothetical protein